MNTCPPTLFADVRETVDRRYHRQVAEAQLTYSMKMREAAWDAKTRLTICREEYHIAEADAAREVQAWLDNTQRCCRAEQDMSIAEAEEAREGIMNALVQYGCSMGDTLSTENKDVVCGEIEKPVRL